MKYTLAFGLMSFAVLFAALSNPGIPRYLLIWTAISFAGVACAYAGAGTRVFNKRPTGKLPLLNKALLLPYLLFAWLVWHLYRLMRKEDHSNRISDDLVIGRRLLPTEAEKDFDYYIDLTAEFDEPKKIRIEESYRSFPILDANTPNASDLKEWVQSIQNGKVFVHCAQGHGRTGVFALALLYHRGQIKTVAEGMDLLQSHRPALNLNQAQLKFIEAYLN